MIIVIYRNVLEFFCKPCTDTTEFYTCIMLSWTIIHSKKRITLLKTHFNKLPSIESVGPPGGPESVPSVGKMTRNPVEYVVPFNAMWSGYRRYSASKLAASRQRTSYSVVPQRRDNMYPITVVTCSTPLRCLDKVDSYVHRPISLSTFQSERWLWIKSS